MKKWYVSIHASGNIDVAQEKLTNVIKQLKSLDQTITSAFIYDASNKDHVAIKID